MKKRKEKKLSREKIISIIKEYASLAVVLFFVTASFIQGSLVPTSSMVGTIMIGDRVLVNKLAYDLTTPRNIPFTDIELPHLRLLKWGSPQKGDIVVFLFPGNREEIKYDKVESWVKRCVAEPGDTLEVVNKVAFVNGKQLPIPVNVRYANSQTKPKSVIEADIFPKGSGFNSDNYGPVVVPKKNDVIELSLNNIEKWRTFINREFEKDAVEVNNGKIYINGKETKQYTVKDDYYFMMGDNRDESYDCRYWGFVPRRNVIGKPMFVYFSWNSDIPFSDMFELIKSIRLDRICKLVH
jgi:signal peptidase I